MGCHQITNSPTWNTDGTVNMTFVVFDVEDDAQAIAIAAATSPTTYHGAFRKGIPQTTTVGHKIHEVVFTYVPPQFAEPEIPETGPATGVVEFDTSGATLHITQAPYGQMWWPASAPNRGTSIGETSDGLEGVDVIIPKLTFQITIRWNLFAVTGQYIQNLASLTGAVNSAPFMIGNWYEPGELLFLGARGTSNGLEYWEIVYYFEASANRYNIPWALSQQQGHVPFKAGHDYMWFSTKMAAVTDQALKRVVEYPEAAYVARVYPWAHFSTYLGF